MKYLDVIIFSLNIFVITQSNCFKAEAIYADSVYADYYYLRKKQ